MSWRSNPNPTLKPPLGSYIDWSHPLAEGLVGCWLLNEDSGQLVNDLCSGLSSPISGAVWKNNGLFFDHKVGNNINIGQRFYLNVPLTLFCKFRLADSPSVEPNSHMRIFDQFTAADYRGVCLDIYWDGTNNVLYVENGTGTVNDAATSTKTYSVGEWSTAAYTHANNTKCLFVNGKLSDTFTGIGYAPETDLDFLVGQNNQVWEADFGGNIECFLVWHETKALSESDIEWLSTESYAFIAWPSRRVIFDFGAVTGLIVVDISQPQTLDSFAITQVHNLAINGSSQAQALDNIDLTQAHLLTVQETNQAQTTDSNLLLSQVHNLVLNDIAQTQTPDSDLLLSQIHNLTLNKVTQTQALDSFNLTQVHNLVVQGLGQIQTLDNVTLDLSVILQIAGLSQSQVLDQFALTQVHNLATNDISQSQTLDNIVLTQQHLLQVAELAQGQTLENIDLSTAIILAIADILQSQNVDAVVITQAHVIAVDNLGQIQTLDATDLLQQHNLTVNDLLSGQTIQGDLVVVDESIIPEPIKVFSADGRTFIFTTSARKFIFDKER